MTVNGSETQLTGRVVSVNEKGIKFEGAGAWLNVSKYAVGVVLPERGQEVTVTLDKAGFLRAVQPTNGSEATMTQNAAPGASSSQHRDRTITRLAVLKAAVERAKDRPEATTSDVLKIAEAFERWVLRPYDGAELADAF